MTSTERNFNYLQNKGIPELLRGYLNLGSLQKTSKPLSESLRTVETFKTKGALICSEICPVC